MLRTISSQATYQLRLFLRSPRALIAAAATPLVLMAMLAAISDHTTEPGYHARLVASMATLGIASTCYTTLAASVVASRDAGVLKRLLATPLPLWAHLSGRIAATVAVTVAQTAVLVAVAAVVYGAPLRVPGMVSTTAIAGLLVGAVAVCAIGLAVAHLVPRGDSAATVLSTSLLPVVLVSGIFFPVGQLPGWVGYAAQASPFTHIVQLLGNDTAARHFAWLLGWTALALAFTAWRMRELANGVESGAAPKRRLRRSVA